MPVCLVGDIDRGGVIAAVVGTGTVLDAADRALIAGFLINKLRGDPALFEDGVRIIERHTGWPCFGVIPWEPAALRLPVGGGADGCGSPHRCCRVWRIMTTPIRCVWSRTWTSRSWRPADSAGCGRGDAVRDQVDDRGSGVPAGAGVGPRHPGARAGRGGRVVGVCGGLQMLGRRVHDPAGADGPAGSVDGLGLLDMETTMHAEKTVRPARGRCALSDAPVAGYEIHTGRSHGADLARPMFHLETGADGARSADGLVEGTYLHGLFANDAYRRAWLERIGAGTASSLQYEAAVDAALDEVVDTLSSTVDLDALFGAARRPNGAG